MIELCEAEHHDTIDLDDLKAADIPHASCENLSITLEAKTSSAESVAADTRATLDEYLSNFIPPTGKGCVACGRKQGGMLGAFVWGIFWGEGTCGHCGYPARGHHRITKDDEEIAEIDNMVLQYHPSVLENSHPRTGLPMPAAEPREPVPGG